MLENHRIICFAPSDWWGMNPSCTTHIMRKLAAKNKILYINPFGSDLLGGLKRKKGLTARIARKLKSIVKCLRQPEKNLYVFSPVFLPLQGKAAIDIVNNALLKLQIKIVCRLIGLSKPTILWLENIRAADIMNCFDPVFKAYNVSDLFANNSYIANQQIQHQWEKRICEESDLVICVSKELHAVKRAERENVFYVPHGVDFDLFQQAARRTEEILEELADVRRPIAGYFGTLTAYNDIEMLLWCARNMPDVSFVLAGQITGGDYSELKKLGNVYFLGRIPYEKIPRLCANFDVCMLQWKMSKWIESCNPLKMFEYMASGKPIVSVPIKEAMQYADVISITHNKEEFCRAIRSELQNDTMERSRRRVEIAAKHCWDNQVEKISDLIMQAMAVKHTRKENAPLVTDGSSIR